VAPAMRERRRPSHTAHAAMKSKMEDASVIQAPIIHMLTVPRENIREAVLESVPGPAAMRTRSETPSVPWRVSRTSKYREMSIANAAMVRRPAMKERSDANRVTATCDEKRDEKRKNRRAIEVAAVAVVGIHQC
jgi:hypothetical protein